MHGEILDQPSVATSARSAGHGWKRNPAEAIFGLPWSDLQLEKGIELLGQPSLQGVPHHAKAPSSDFRTNFAAQAEFVVRTALSQDLGLSFLFA